MDISRLRELGGVDNAKPQAKTVNEVLIENKSANVGALTNRLRKAAGMDPITESVDVVEEACDCTTEGCDCGGKKCDCGGKCKCPNCCDPKTA